MSFAAFIHSLGFFAYPLGVIALVAAAVIVERVCEAVLAFLASHKVQKLQKNKGSLLDYVKALNKSESEGSGLLHVLSKSEEYFKQGRATAYRVALHHLDTVHVPALRARLWVILLASQIAPALGLAGTVFGMARSFETLGANASPQAQELAAAISTAMNTTLAGLAISIPALIAYFSFSALVTRHSNIAEQAVNCLLEELALRKRGQHAKP